MNKESLYYIDNPSSNVIKHVNCLPRHTCYIAETKQTANTKYEEVEASSQISSRNLTFTLLLTVVCVSEI